MINPSRSVAGERKFPVYLTVEASSSECKAKFNSIDLPQPPQLTRWLFREIQSIFWQTEGISNLKDVDGQKMRKIVEGKRSKKINRKTFRFFHSHCWGESAVEKAPKTPSKSLRWSFTYFLLAVHWENAEVERKREPLGQLFSVFRAKRQRRNHRWCKIFMIRFQFRFNLNREPLFAFALSKHSNQQTKSSPLHCFGAFSYRRSPPSPPADATVRQDEEGKGNSRLSEQ